MLDFKKRCGGAGETIIFIWPNKKCIIFLFKDMQYQFITSPKIANEFVNKKGVNQLRTSANTETYPPRLSRKIILEKHTMDHFSRHNCDFSMIKI